MRHSPLDIGRASLLALAVALLGCASAVPPRSYAAMNACPIETPAPDGAALISRFYAAFDRKDFAAMACCYHRDVVFQDPMFGPLAGKRALAMWAMLTSQPGDLRVSVSGITANGEAGHAHWDADYTFPFLLFKNQVHNSIDGTYEFKDGKIFRHTDAFDLKAWMKVALAPLGGAISEDTIRGRVRARLDDFIANHAEFQETAR